MYECILISGSRFPGSLEKLVLQTSWTSTSGDLRGVWVLYTGRLLWAGNGILFTKTPLGKNMVGKVPSDMTTHLHINEPKKYTFHSYRWAAASAVADAGATSDQMHMVGKMPK